MILLMLSYIQLGADRGYVPLKRCTPENLVKQYSLGTRKMSFSFDIIFTCNKVRYSNMKKVYIATNKALAIANQLGGEWSVELQLVGLATQCLAADPLQPEEVYCGTFGQGLWHSHDAGRTWEKAGANMIGEQVMSVAISPL